MSAQIVGLSQHRRVRAVAAALARMAEGRVEDLISLQHLMLDRPDLGEALLRQALSGHTMLVDAAPTARQLLVEG